jgi:hypothetical protein
MTSGTAERRSTGKEKVRPPLVKYEAAKSRARSDRRFSNDEVLHAVIGWAKESGIDEADLLPAVAIVFEALKSYPTR